MPSQDPKYVKVGDSITATWANSVVGRIKKTVNGRGRMPLQGASGSGEPCPFGDTFIDSDNSNAFTLVGGYVFVGNKNHFIEKYDLKSNNPRNAFVFVKIPCIVNVDDDAQILLPGVKTDNGNPVIEENSTNVPDNTNPSLPSGAGVLYVPVGRLVFDSEANSMTFEPAECGNIRAEHCSGTLSYSRNNVSPTTTPPV